MDLNENMSYSLSDADIKNLLYDKNIKIMSYDKLEDYNNIEELLPRRRDAVIILYRRKENYGHWVCLCKDDKKLFFFDPLGYRPDKQLLWTEKYLRKTLNQDEPHLSYLLNDALKRKYKIYFNETKYQKEEQAINTCGRHIVNFINYFMKSENPSFRYFYNSMKYNLEHHELNNFDLLVSKIIN
jgi:hypothetical protein